MVSSMKTFDVRRLWGQTHNSSFRDNCYAYYREATFDPAEGTKKTVYGGFMRKLAANSTEKKVILAVLTVFSIGIGATSALAWSSQSAPDERVGAYVDSLRKDWEGYQESAKKS